MGVDGLPQTWCFKMLGALGFGSRRDFAATAFSATPDARTSATILMQARIGRSSSSSVKSKVQNNSCFCPMLALLRDCRAE